MKILFNEIIYRPLFNALILIYDYLPDMGVAVVLLTILVRIVLFPIFYKSAKDQAIMQKITPKIKEIQKSHKHDKEKQARALMELYREHKVNPLSGLALLLVQLPVLFALYGIASNGFAAESLNYLYASVSRPESLNNYFLGLIDLTKRDNFIIVLAALAQYFQGKISLPREKNNGSASLSPAEAVGRQMVYVGPLLTFFFLYSLKLPAMVGLFWLTTTLFSIVQQIIINKRLKINGKSS